MKRFLLSLAMMASILNAPPKSISPVNILKALELKKDVSTFIALEVAQNRLTNRQFTIFMRKQEEEIRDLVTRINTLLNAYPEDTKIASFIFSRNHLQELLNKIEAK